MLLLTMLEIHRQIKRMILKFWPGTMRDALKDNRRNKDLLDEIEKLEIKKLVSEYQDIFRNELPLRLPPRLP